MHNYSAVVKTGAFLWTAEQLLIAMTIQNYKKKPYYKWNLG